MLTDLALLIMATSIGVAAGIITGLLPGVHINLVSTILLSLAPAIALHVPLLHICILIVAMSITHTFLDTIPSIFLGAPDEADAMGVLPGHRYLLQGNGLMAIKLAVIGGILGTAAAVIFFYPFLLLTLALNGIIRPFLFWVMLAIIAFMILHDRKKILALLIFLWSGLLGTVVLRLSLKEPLLPLLSGMFGIATLIYSINENQNIPEQKDLCYTQFEPGKTLSGCIRGTLAGFITALLPGVSAASASAVTAQGSKMGDHGFMVLLGSLGTASFILSLAAFIAIEKARNGAMAVIVELSAITAGTSVIYLSAALIATGAASLLTISLARKAALWLPKIPYVKTCVAVILFVVCIVWLRTGWLGMCVLIASTSVGLLPASLKTARAQAMGCLLLPLLILLW